MSTAAQEDYHADNSQVIDQSKDFLTVVIAGQMFGIPILQVQDVLGDQVVTKVPLAPPEVAGSLNLRGRIVTAINVRTRLGLPPLEEDKNFKPADAKTTQMSVVVELDTELYSLMIDSVGDVLTLKDDKFEPTPVTLDPIWRDIASGIYRLERELIVILDVPKFLDSVHS